MGLGRAFFIMDRVVIVSWGVWVLLLRCGLFVRFHILLLSSSITISQHVLEWDLPLFGIAVSFLHPPNHSVPDIHPPSLFPSTLTPTPLPTF